MSRVWVTGAKGSIGQALMARLSNAVGTDLDVNVTHYQSVRSFWHTYGPFDQIVHCAGAKHAPDGELDPAEIADINIGGLDNVLSLGVPTVLASTCKAADPETAYGASKLIAERMTLNAGGTVARFYNVRETSGNVFEIWRNWPADQPLPVTKCWRYFISLNRAVSLVEWAMELPSGRYTVDPGKAQFMPHLATELHPERPLHIIPPRRGDRIREPRKAAAERITPVAGLDIERIINRHDPC